MSKRKLFFIIFFLLCFSFLSLQADVILDMKLRFFEGVRVGEAEPPRIVTSSYLQPTVTANIVSKFLLSEEKEQIKKVFNLKDVQLITEADLKWESKKGKIAHVFRINGREYLLRLSPLVKEYLVFSKDKNQKGANQFKIEIFELNEQEKNNLLETEIILPEKNIAVFGFENREGTPYFLSFHVSGVKVKVPPPPMPPPPPEVERAKKIQEFQKGAVKVEGEIKPPKLIKKVNPIYPEEARQKRVSGVVILGVRTDIYGRVKNAMIYRSKDPLLDEAAMDAVRQWIYEPLLIKGKPREVVFTVTVSFKLKGKKDIDKADEEFFKGAVVARGEIKPPKLIKKVDPIYPEEAKEAKVQGVVLLQARTDEKGNVVKVKVLRSESSMLNDSAIDALKQWKYEPCYKNGKPVPVVFTVTIKYKLK